MIRNYVKFIFKSDYGLEKAVNIISNGNNKNKFLTAFCNRKLKNKNILVRPTAKVGKNLYLPHPYNITIGEGVIIGNDCSIYHEVTLGQNKGKYPTLKDNVILYPGAKVVGNVVVGNNSIVGANSVVTRDVPDNTIVMGIPAKVVGKRKLNDTYY